MNERRQPTVLWAIGRELIVVLVKVADFDLQCGGHTCNAIRLRRVKVDLQFIQRCVAEFMVSGTMRLLHVDL
jgi:hypothetical protein